VRNYGAAFGILADADLPYQAVLFSGLSLAALIAIGVYAYRLPAEAQLPQMALSLILGGAVGNLIDRLRLGYVVDFVHVYWKHHQWPDFNAADSAITIGVSLLILDILRSPQTEGVPNPDKLEAASPAGRTE
jgi:signal peptidase II